MDENEKKNINDSIKSFIGDRLSRIRESDARSREEALKKEAEIKGQEKQGSGRASAKKDQPVITPRKAASVSGTAAGKVSGVTGSVIDRANIRQPKSGFSTDNKTSGKDAGAEKITAAAATAAGVTAGSSAEEEKKAQEKKAAEEAKAEAQRIKAEKKAEADKLKAERKAESDKLKAERKAESDKLKAERKAESDKLKAEREEEKRARLEEKRAAAEEKKAEALKRKTEAAAAAGGVAGAQGAEKESAWKEKFQEFKRSISENDFEGTDIEEEDAFEHVSMDDGKRRTRGLVKLFATLGAAAAIAIIAIVFSLRNNSYDHIFNQGVNQFNSEEYDDAVATFEKLYELEPGKKDTELMRYLAESYVKKNRYKEALEIYNKALETDPNYGPAVTGLCAMYTQMKDGKALNDTLEKYRGTNLESFTDEYKVSMPESDPKPGTYEEDFEVRFTGTSGIPIFYTTDGSEPTAKSKIYTTPIKVSEGTSNIKAISINNLGIKSGILDGKYTVQYKVPGEPVINLNSGIYITGQTVEILSDDNTTVYYTTDGSTPTGMSTRYDGPLRLVRGNVILSAIAISNHGKQSTVAVKNYIIVRDSKELEDVEKSNSPTTPAPANNNETQPQQGETTQAQEQASGEGQLTPAQEEALEGARQEAEEEAQSVN